MSSLGGFSVSLESDSCCFDVVFLSCVLQEPVGSQTICLDCDAPVQTVGSTWGRLKAHYR